MIKLIATDYDGTLFQNKTVSQYDIQAIKQFQQQGNLFGICTGRHLDSILAKIEKYQIPYDFLITNNGNNVWDKQLNLIYSSAFDAQLVQEVIDYFQTELYDHVYFIALNDNKKYGRLLFHQGSPFMPLDANSLFDIDINQVTTIFSEAIIPSETQAIVDKCNAHFKQRVQVYNYDPYIDIVQKPWNKANGLGVVLKYYNIDQSQAYTIGDSHNDVSMFKQFQSFAIESGEEELKTLSIGVVSNVAEAIEKL